MVKGMGGLRCTEVLTDGRLAGKVCNQKLGDELLGWYQTTCPKCGTPVAWTVYGERTIEDETGVTVISVKRLTAAR